MRREGWVAWVGMFEIGEQIGGGPFAQIKSSSLKRQILRRECSVHVLRERIADGDGGIDGGVEGRGGWR